MHIKIIQGLLLGETNNVIDSYMSCYLPLFEKLIMNCNRCESENIELLEDEYKGDYTILAYQCLDCNHKTTNYYDIKYTNTNPFDKTIQQEKVA